MEQWQSAPLDVGADFSNRVPETRHYVSHPKPDRATSSKRSIADIASRCENAQMRTVFIIISLLAVAGCASTQKNSRAALMDEIESSIRLPSGAEPLESYARYYTEHNGSVLGAYTTEIEAPRPSNYGCEELGLKGGSTKVACPALADARPGERRWVKFEDYPAVAGKNCTAIQLEFDPRAKIITYLACANPPH